VIFLIGGIAGKFFATQARMNAVDSAFSNMRTEFREQIREIRHSLETLNSCSLP
jgi:hypothetical protein